jgi:arsenate reductase
VAAGGVPRFRLPGRPGDGLGHRRPAAHTEDTGLQLLDNSAATAAGLFAIIPMFGPVSGGQFNPVVSLVYAYVGGLTRRDVLAERDQHLDPSSGEPCPPVRGGDRHARAAARDLRARPHGPGEHRAGRVGAYLGAAYWFTSSTSFANPAITVGRMFSDTFAGIAPASVPGFVVVQLVGGLVAFGLIRALYPDVTAVADDVVVPHEGEPAAWLRGLGSPGR